MEVLKSSMTSSSHEITNTAQFELEDAAYHQTAVQRKLGGERAVEIFETV